MKDLRKKCFISVACLIGAAFFFFLGIISERRFAADRLQVSESLELDAIAGQAPPRVADQDIDINALDFPEALRDNENIASDAMFPSNGSDGAPALDRPPNIEEHAHMTFERRNDIYLQTGAFTTMERATAWMQSLAEKGFEPFVVPSVETSQGGPYRVRLGPFSSLENASVVIRKLEQHHVAFIIVERRSN
jgi:cell division septation protein DedD